MAYGKIKADSLVYDSSGSDVELNLSNIADKSGTTFTGDLVLNAQKDLRFADADSSNYVAFQAPATVGSNVVWTLPAADGTSGQQLSTNGSGTLSWSDATNVAAGSLSGTTMAANVVTSSLTTVGTLGGLTIDGDVTFTGASSNGTWDKSANAFLGNLTGTASISSAITVADESSDTDCFVGFFTTNSGNLPMKVGTNLKFNSSSGLLTASGFAGDGYSLTNINGGNIATGTIAAARIATLNQNTTGSSGSCTGNAVSADTVDVSNIGTNAGHYLAFTSASGAGQTIGVDGNLEYNPSTNTITCGSIDISKRYTTGRDTITQSSTPTIDCDTGNYFTLTQNQNITSWTLSNIPSNGRAYAFTLELQNSSYSTAWSGFTNLKWPAGTAPSLSASKAHLIIFVTDDGGSNWRGAAIVDYTV